MQELDWDDLRFVLSVARCQSLAGAARQLGVNESTVGRHISRVERSLGTRLFERSLGSFRATEAGCAVIHGAEGVEALVHRLESTASGKDELSAGTVRITTVPMIVNRVLVPALPALLEEHPQLRVELIAEPRDLSLTKREADLALRLARPKKELSTIARRIDQLEYAVYEPLNGPAGQKPWITYEDSMADLPQCRWIADQIKSEHEEILPIKVNDAEAIISAIVAGLGMSLLPIAVGDREHRIRRRGKGQPPFFRELWLLTHPDVRDLVRVKVAIDWLISSVRRFTGTAESGSH